MTAIQIVKRQSRRDRSRCPTCNVRAPPCPIRSWTTPSTGRNKHWQERVEEASGIRACNSAGSKIGRLRFACSFVDTRRLVGAVAKASDQVADAERDGGGRVGALLDRGAQEVTGLAASFADGFRGVGRGLLGLAVHLLQRTFHLPCLTLELRLHITSRSSESFLHLSANVFGSPAEAIFIHEHGPPHTSPATAGCCSPPQAPSRGNRLLFLRRSSCGARQSSAATLVAHQASALRALAGPHRAEHKAKYQRQRQCCVRALLQRFVDRDCNVVANFADSLDGFASFVLRVPNNTSHVSHVAACCHS